MSPNNAFESGVVIVPRHKSDTEACRALGSASDEEVHKHIEELLTWVQDMNWPVAPLVLRRVKTLGMPLVKPIREILNGTDHVWKYWIVSALLPGVDTRVIDSLRRDLERIVAAPTAGELEEEVAGAARALLGAEGRITTR